MNLELPNNLLSIVNYRIFALGSGELIFRLSLAQGFAKLFEGTSNSKNKLASKNIKFIS